MVRPSGVRSILEDVAASTSSGGEWLNLSPGNPARIPEVLETWRRLESEALAEDFPELGCSYGPTRGSDGLVDAVVDYFNTRYGWNISAENVLVGPGVQMLCFAAATVFTGSSQRLVLPLVPDYTGYQSLSLEGGLVGVEPRLEVHGDRDFRYAVDIEAVRRRQAMGMMLVSSPGNPTCRSLDADELQALIDIAEDRDIPLVIDHAYGDPFPGIADSRVDPPFHPNVINCFSMSKAGLPGERLGFAIGASEAIEPMMAFLSNSVLHAPQLIQAVVRRALTSGELDRLASTVIKPYYRDKRRLTEKILHENLPQSVSWRLYSSEGGMFCWLWIDHSWFDDLTFYNALKRKQVFTVPGRYFFSGPSSKPSLAGHDTRCIRLSLSAHEAVVQEGINRLAETVKEMSAY